MIVLAFSEEFEIPVACVVFNKKERRGKNNKSDNYFCKNNI